MSNDFGIKVSKKGVDVKTAGYKDLIFSSQFNTVKIKHSGTLVLNLPNETWGGSPAYETSRTYEAELVHNIGDIALVLPRISKMVSYTDAGVTSGGNYVVNDLEEQDIPIYGYGFDVIESVDVIMTATKLKLRVTRENYGGSNINFKNRTATLYYTIFHNRADVEFNLL